MPNGSASNGSRPGRGWLLGLVGTGLVVALVAGAFYGWQAFRLSAYEQAVTLLPAGTLRASYTDWSQVRALADGADLDAGSSSRDVARFLSRAFDRDLTAASAVADATYPMIRRYGFSPLDAEWEMFAQSPEGAVAVLRARETVDLVELERALRTLGYQSPVRGAGSGGVWAGSPDLVAGIDPGLTPVLQNVVVLPEERIVLLSDEAAYALAAAEAVTGDAARLVDETDGVEALAGLLEQPVAAVLFASDFACEALGLAGADPEDRELAEQAVEQAGGLSPVAGVVLGLSTGGSLRVGLHFETSDQAEENLEPRVALASGEAFGQGGAFTDRFRVVEGRADGQQVTLDLEPAEEDAMLLSDLAQGPVVFASC